MVLLALGFGARKALVQSPLRSADPGAWLRGGLGAWPRRGCGCKAVKLECMSKFVVFFEAALIAFAFNPVAVFAKCENGVSPSYDDILAIQFQRQGCGQNSQPTISCSSYSMYVSNWDPSQQQVAEYSQFTLPSAVGKYKLNVTGADVIAILKDHNFLQLNPPNIAETDVGYSVLTVKHCAVITRISLPPENAAGPFMRIGGGLDHATTDLFEALDSFVQGAPKSLLSKKPSDVNYNWDGIL